MYRPNDEKKSEQLIGGPMPLYYQIADLIRNTILEGAWPPESRLPTENKMAQKYGVSRPTIRSAKDMLSKEGLIRSVKGSGCYVNGRKVWKTRLPLVKNLNDIFHHGSKMSFKIHEFAMVSNPEEIKRKLKTPQDRFVFQIKGVRWYQDQPISYAIYYLPFRFGSRIPLESLDENPFIPQLEKLAGVKVVEGVQNISLDQAGSEEAKNLGIDAGGPVLMVKTVYFDDQEQPVEYVETKYRQELPYSIRVKRD